jgi:hypothetical protein
MIWITYVRTSATLYAFHFVGYKNDRIVVYPETSDMILSGTKYEVHGVDMLNIVYKL